MRPMTVLFALSALGLLAGCRHTVPANDERESRWADFEPLVAMEAAPTYHALQGYDPTWLRHVREGVEASRAYWGSYGPVHVWVLGQQDDTPIKAGAKRAFIEEYAVWRTATSPMSLTEGLAQGQKRLFDPAEDGDSEAYLSELRDTEPHQAELIFINVHRWYFDKDAIPDPVLRGIHEYTHVFQMSVGPIPTWMAEGTAVFAEAWLPGLDGRRAPEVQMRRSMESAHKMRGTGFTIADMEEIESAPTPVAKHHRELAYDTGAWAIAFMVHRSTSRSVASLRDEFYPLVKKLGWETALPRYVGMKSKTEFYEAFTGFMKRPIEEQLKLLGDLAR